MDVKCYTLMLCKKEKDYVNVESQKAAEIICIILIFLLLYTVLYSSQQ